MFSTETKARATKEARARVVSEAHKHTVTEFVEANTAKTAHVYTDENSLYQRLDRPVSSFDAFQFRIRPCGRGHAILIKGFPPFPVDSIPEDEIRMVRVVRTPVRVEAHILTR